MSRRRCAQRAQLVAHQRLAERLRQMTRAAVMTPVPRHLTAEAPPSREVSTTDNELRGEWRACESGHQKASADVGVSPHLVAALARLVMGALRCSNDGWSAQRRRQAWMTSLPAWCSTQLPVCTVCTPRPCSLQLECTTRPAAPRGTTSTVSAALAPTSRSGCLAQVVSTQGSGQPHRARTECEHGRRGACPAPRRWCGRAATAPQPVACCSPRSPPPRPNACQARAGRSQQHPQQQPGRVSCRQRRGGSAGADTRAQ